MKLLKTFFSFIILFLSFSSASYAAVQQVTQTDTTPPQISDLTIVFANVLGVVSTLASFAIFIMFIRAGIAYITAQGDPKAIAAARSTMTYAIIGFVVILSAYLIISFIWGVAKLPGLPAFCVPGPAGTRTCPL